MTAQTPGSAGHQPGFFNPAKAALVRGAPGSRSSRNNESPSPARHSPHATRHLLAPVLCMAGIVAISNVLVQYPLGEWLTYAAFSYPLSYFVTEVCNRWAGPALARRVAWAGFVTGVALSLAFQVGWRIALASGTAFIISQLLDIAVFNWLRNKTWWKAPLWAASAASALDTVIFFSIAFAGTEVPWHKLAAGDLGVKFAMAVVLLAPFRVFIVWMGLVPRREIKN